MRAGPDRLQNGGACFGYAPTGPLEFSFLRTGGGDLLTVTADDVPAADPSSLLLEWHPRPENPFAARVHADQSGYRVWMAELGWYAVEPAVGRITVPRLADPLQREQRLWGIPAMLSFIHRGDLPLHAAAVDVDGAAVLVVGPTRFGKTTLAAGFHAAGHRLLTEDLACVQMGSQSHVLPGPPTIRLRRDVARWLDLPEVNQLAVTEDRVHLAVSPARRGDAAGVPLAAIVFLRIGPAGGLKPVDPTAGLPSLWVTSLNLPSDQERRRCFEGIVHLAATVPMFAFERQLELDRLLDDVDLLADLVHR